MDDDLILNFVSSSHFPLNEDQVHQSCADLDSVYNDELNNFQIVISDGEHTPDISDSDCELIYEESSEADDRLAFYDEDVDWMQREMPVSPQRCTIQANNVIDSKDRCKGVTKIESCLKPEMLSRGTQVGLCKCIQLNRECNLKTQTPVGCLEGCEEQRKLLVDNMRKLLITARKQIKSLKQKVNDLEKKCDASGLAKCPNCKLIFKETKSRLFPRYLRVLRGKLTVEVEFDSMNHLREWLILSGLDTNTDGMPSIVEMEDGKKMNLRDVGSFLPDFAIQLTREMFRREAVKTRGNAVETEGKDEERKQTSQIGRPSTVNSSSKSNSNECVPHSPNRSYNVSNQNLLETRNNSLRKVQCSSLKHTEFRAQLRRSPRKRNRKIDQQQEQHTARTENSLHRRMDSEEKQGVTRNVNEDRRESSCSKEVMQRIAPAEPLQGNQTPKWAPLSRKRKLQTEQPEVHRYETIAVKDRPSRRESRDKERMPLEKRSRYVNSHDSNRIKSMDSFHRKGDRRESRDVKDRDVRDNRGPRGHLYKRR